jgi:hypothetical protein
MSHRRGFTPGNKSYAKRMINYNAIYNELMLNPNSFNFQDNTLECLCVSNKYNKLVLASDSSSTNISNNTRISQIVNFYKGGKTQYGNFYLGQPLNLNYLGRFEGMPGGSGTPPRNF